MDGLTYGRKKRYERGRKEVRKGGGKVRKEKVSERIFYLAEQSALHQGTPDPHQNLQL